MALDDIKEKYSKDEMGFAFTYMFIDESQDFDENFFDLCELVTEKNVYVAGDIFQSIFDETISSTITPAVRTCYQSWRSYYTHCFINLPSFSSSFVTRPNSNIPPNYHMQIPHKTCPWQRSRYPHVYTTSFCDLVCYIVR